MFPTKHIPLIVLALLLLFSGCVTADKKEAAVKNAACNWPPDTMKITIQGSGEIAVNFLWKDAAKRASPCPSQTFVLSMTHTALAPTPQAMVKESHTPQDTTPAGMVASILSGAPPPPGGGNDLLLVRWPPDTTTGGDK
jgi:hypothetical protein